MKSYICTSIAAMSVFLSGCATIVEGRTQEIHMNLTPENTDCIAYRKGQAIGNLNKVTRVLSVTKSRDDMTITCTAQGYKDKTAVFSSSASAWGVVGALTLDLGLIDYTTGALNKYEGTITMVLERS